MEAEEMKSCTLGRRVRYVRRKSDARCFNPVEAEAVMTPCGCTAEDWVCAAGYSRKMEKGLCQPEGAPEYSEPPSNCTGNFTRYLGYTKAPGNVCEGGVEFVPTVEECPPPPPQPIVAEEVSEEGSRVVWLGVLGVLLCVVVQLAK